MHDGEPGSVLDEHGFGAECCPGLAAAEQWVGYRWALTWSGPSEENVGTVNGNPGGVWGDGGQEEDSLAVN